MTYSRGYPVYMNTEITAQTLQNRLVGAPTFVLRKVDNVLSEYEKDEAETSNIVFEVCPKCASVHPRLIKGGKTLGGKQMYRCKECNARFVADYNEVTFHSRLSKSQWSEAVKAAVVGHSIVRTANLCDISVSTSFKMRHKIMTFLEKDEDKIEVADEVELDEKYLLQSHKGTKINEVDSRHRGMPASKRGISEELICLLTAVDRSGSSFLRAYNMGRPTSDDVMNLSSHIKEESYLWTDNHASYNKLADKLGSKKVIVSPDEKHDKVNHLNNVNSFHSSIQKWYERMRGVATKYINRYAALYNLRWLCRGLDDSESLMKAKKRIKSLGSSISLNWDQLSSSNLFRECAYAC